LGWYVTGISQYEYISGIAIKITLIILWYYLKSQLGMYPPKIVFYMCRPQAFELAADPKKLRGHNIS
jgi:hypothetical protein